MESISSQQPNNGIHRDDDYRKRILQSMCAFYIVFGVFIDLLSERKTNKPDLIQHL